MSGFLQEFFGTLFLGVLAYLVLWVAWKKQFFHIALRESRFAFLTFLHVLAVFVIYFASVIFLFPLLQGIFEKLFLAFKLSPSLFRVSIAIHFCLAFLISCFLFFFGKIIRPEISKAIWNDNSVAASKEHFKIALLAWLIAYPLMLFVSQAIDLFLNVLLHIQELPDQAAVHSLKFSMNDPIDFFLNIVLIVGFAPFIEEYIFRGFLQSYIRKFFQLKAAIALSSFCFACFHFSPEQGFSNIPIIGSLWVFSLFLGFVYERQGSLLAPLFLHAIFNGLSILNVYFLGDAPRGAL